MESLETYLIAACAAEFIALGGVARFLMAKISDKDATIAAKDQEIKRLNEARAQTDREQIKELREAKRLLHLADRRMLEMSGTKTPKSESK